MPHRNKTNLNSIGIAHLITGFMPEDEPYLAALSGTDTKTNPINSWDPVVCLHGTSWDSDDIDIVCAAIYQAIKAKLTADITDWVSCEPVVRDLLSLKVRAAIATTNAPGSSQTVLRAIAKMKEEDGWTNAPLYSTKDKEDPLLSLLSAQPVNTLSCDVFDKALDVYVFNGEDAEMFQTLHALLMQCKLVYEGVHAPGPAYSISVYEVYKQISSLIVAASTPRAATDPRSYYYTGAFGLDEKNKPTYGYNAHVIPGGEINSFNFNLSIPDTPELKGRYKRLSWTKDSDTLTLSFKGYIENAKAQDKTRQVEDQGNNEFTQEIIDSFTASIGDDDLLSMSQALEAAQNDSF